MYCHLGTKVMFPYTIVNEVQVCMYNIDAKMNKYVGYVGIQGSETKEYLELTLIIIRHFSKQLDHEKKLNDANFLNSVDNPTLRQRFDFFTEHVFIVTLSSKDKSCLVVYTMTSINVNELDKLRKSNRPKTLGQPRFLDSRLNIVMTIQGF